MHYQVPQFIEIEDKIFGPLTLKQFIYVAGGGGVCLICFTLLPTIIAIFLSLPFVVLALALAFYTINGRPFIVTLEHGFKFLTSSKLFLWKQRVPEAESAPEVRPPPSAGVLSANLPQITQSRLHDLAWSLNIKDSFQNEGVTRTKNASLEV